MHQLPGAGHAIVAISRITNVTLNAPIKYLGNALMIDTNTVDIKGKVVALEANSQGINLNVSLPTWRYPTYIYNKYGGPLLRKGAIAIMCGPAYWAPPLSFRQNQDNLREKYISTLVCVLTVALKGVATDLCNSPVKQLQQFKLLNFTTV